MANNTGEEPKIIDGGIAFDDRGSVAFVNDFNFKGIKRFYIVSNHRSGFVRAWHAHKNEAKYVLMLSGSAVVGTVKIDDFDKPSEVLPTNRYVLSANKPSVLYIPAGYGNGFMTLTEDTKVMFLSTSSLEESKDDDYRFDARFWDIWRVIER